MIVYIVTRHINEGVVLYDYGEVVGVFDSFEKYENFMYEHKDDNFYYSCMVWEVNGKLLKYSVPK